MKRHLDKLKKCIIVNETNKLSDSALYEESLIKHEKLTGKKIEHNEYICKRCCKIFSNKGNLNKHLKTVCTKININDTILYDTENNEEINTKIHSIKGFDEDWDVSHIDHKKKGEILFTNSKFTKTLENILCNDINFNIIMNNDNDKTGIVYLKKKNKYEPIVKKDIIEQTMKKIYNHVKDFYNEIINNNIDDLSVLSLTNELNIFEKKYNDFINSEDTKNIVFNTLLTIYIIKKKKAEHKYYEFIDETI
jgi:hypothetical protein